MFRRTSSYILLLGILGMAILTSIRSHAQKQETIQAQAFGTTTMSGRNFGITIRIKEYSTPADQQALIEAFNSGGHDALVKVIQKMKSKGRLGITGGLGYQIAYIRNIPTEQGRTVRIITDRPINFGEAFRNTRSRDYDLSLVELHLSRAKSKSTGNLIVGGRFKIDKRTQQIEFESYEATPWRLAGIMQR